MVYILLGEGFEEAEAVIPADVLRRAGAQVAFVGVDGLTVVGARGIVLQADMALEQVDRNAMEMLIIPGGMGGVESIQMNLFAMALIQWAADQGCYLAAICAGPIILGYLGILDRRNAVCYPGLEEELGSAVAHPEQRVVQDGRIITSQGPGTAFEFAFKLAEVLVGDEQANRVREEMLCRREA